MFSSQSSPLGFGKIGVRPQPQNPTELMAALKPASPEYAKLSKWCIEHRTAVDLFLFKGGTQFDLATISPLVTRTGGHLVYFPNYNQYK